MKKSLIILAFIAALASADAQITWGVTNYSSYQCGYRDGYHIIVLSPNMSSLGYEPDATLPTEWNAQYVGDSGQTYSTGGTHRGPVGPTAAKMTCLDDVGQVYVVYSINYDAVNDLYSIGVEFHDR